MAIDDRRRDGRLQQRDVIPIRRRQQLHGRRPSAGNQHARDVVAERRRKDVGAAGGIEALEIADFALAEDENACRLQVGVEAGEREARLLNVGARDGAVETGASAQQLERQANSLGPALQQARNRDGTADSKPLGLRFDQASRLHVGAAEQHVDLVRSMSCGTRGRRRGRRQPPCAASSTDIGFTCVPPGADDPHRARAVVALFEPRSPNAAALRTVCGVAAAAFAGEMP